MAAQSNFRQQKGAGITPPVPNYTSSLSADPRLTSSRAPSSMYPNDTSSYTYPSTSMSYHYQSSNSPRSQPPEYICLFPNCQHSSSRKADLERHVKFTHNRDSVFLVDCSFPGCRRVGKAGFSRRDKMVEHVREFHKVDIPQRVGAETRE